MTRFLFNKQAHSGNVKMVWSIWVTSNEVVKGFLTFPKKNKEKKNPYHSSLLWRSLTSESTLAYMFYVHQLLQ